MGLALGGIVALAAVLRVVAIGEQSFWFDEYVTTTIVTQNLGGILDTVEFVERTPPLYYFLAHVWYLGFGDGEVALRSLSALCGVATVPAVFAATRSLAGERAGLIAAALTAASPLLVWYSQEARAYSLLVLLSALSLLFLTRALRDPDKRWPVWGWAAAAALALATHYFAIVAVIPQAGWLLIRGPDRAPTYGAIGAVAAAGAALIPLLTEHEDRPGFIETLGLGDRLVQLALQFPAGLSTPEPWLAPIALFLLVVAAGLTGRTASSEARRAAIVGASIVFAGGAIALGLAMVGQDHLITRNLLPLWPAAALAVGALVGGARLSGRGQAAIAGGMCAAGVALTTWVALTPAAGKPDWQELGTQLGTSAEPLAVAGPSGDIVALSYYLPGASIAEPGVPVTTGRLAQVSYLQTPDYGIGPCWWGSLCGGEPLFEAAPEVDPTGPLTPDGEGTTDRLGFRNYSSGSGITLPPTDYLLPYLIVPGREPASRSRATGPG
jgi:mannosyltransferase